MDDGRDNWDLSAVVKSCSSTVKLKPTLEDEPPYGCLPLTNFHEKNKYDSLLFHDQYSYNYNYSCCISDLVNPPPPVDHLLHLDVHAASMSGIINVPPPPPPSVLFFHHQKPRPFINRIPQDPLCCHRLPAPPPPSSRSRKRKVQQKRTVTHVTAEKLSSDEWAWRKYGQKPIKGSPYPRNYYRCSSSKGCSARKQVEQSKSDPEIYIVTFTGDHTHPRPNYRNSLAGSTRISSRAASASAAHQRTLELATDQEEEAAGSSSSDLVSVTGPMAPAATGGTVEKGDDDDNDDQDLLMISNLVFDDDDDDDLFKGLEEFTSGAGGRGFGQISPSSFGDNFSTSGDGGGGRRSSPATGGATA